MNNIIKTRRLLAFVFMLGVCLLCLAAFPGRSHAARRSDGVFEMTESELKSLYNKYIVPNLASVSNGKSIEIDETGVSTPEGSLTETGKKRMLDVLNFARGVVGSSPVTWNDSREYYAQKGLDFLKENNKDIDHYAASGVDDDADRGLRNSSLAQGWWVYSEFTHIFEWINDAGVPSLGHRFDVINPSNKSVGIAMIINDNKRSIFTAHNAEGDGSGDQVVCIPTAGVFPIEELEGFYDDDSLWSIQLDSKSSAGSNTAVTISDETGKTVNYTKGDPSQNGDYFSANSKTIMVNPISFTNDRLTTQVGHSYTIRVTGLEGERSSIEYTSKIIDMKSFRPDTWKDNPNSSYKSLTLEQYEVYIKPGETASIGYTLVPDETGSLSASSDDLSVATTAISYWNKKFEVKGYALGDTTVYLFTKDYGKRVAVKVHVVNEIPPEFETRWDYISFETSAVTMKPGETKKVKFSIGPAQLKDKNIFIQHVTEDYATAKFTPGTDYIEVTAIKKGMTTIRIYTPDRKQSAALKITVEGASLPALERFALLSNGKDLMASDETPTYSLKVGEKMVFDYDIKPEGCPISLTPNATKYVSVSFDKAKKQMTVTGSSPGKEEIFVQVNHSDDKYTRKGIYFVVSDEQDEEDSPGNSNPSAPDSPESPDQPSSPSSPDTPSSDGQPESPGASGQPENDKTSVIRLYNRVSGEHLFTTDGNEASVLTHGDWLNEGTGWTAPETGDPVYRLYCDVTKEHLYTTDENEVNTLSSSGVWSIDNNRQPLFYSGGSKPIYRLYNEHAQKHLLTADENEYNVLQNTLWKQEGIALYAVN